MSSMFKKPKRNFRRKAHDSDSDGEKDSNQSEEQKVKEEENGKEEEPVKEIKKVKKKKEKTSVAPTSVLSFEHDEGDEGEVEVFKVKKSSHSRRVAKQLKRESKKEKEEREKREDEEKAKKLESSVSRNGRDDDEDYHSSSSKESDEAIDKDVKPKFKTILERGEIPDAAMIHMARKKRQMAREMGGAGEFIPVEKPKPENTKSRLIREEDDDHTSDEEERLSFSVNTKEQERRRREDVFLAAEHGSNSEGSDQEREWEEQQIRKGVNIPTQAQTESSEGPGYYQQYQQYMYTQSSNIFNPQAPSFDAAPSTKSNSPSVSLGVRAGVAPPAELPQITVDQIKKRLKERLESLMSVHRAHVHEKDDLESRLESTESSIVKMEGSAGGMEEQYQFFQEMRGYVRDLVECLNEKVPIINHMEKQMHNILKVRAQKLVNRRQEDIKDQASEFMSNKGGAGSTMDSAKQRRIAEREARRSRRRRAREAKEIRDHHDGISTDDEISHSEVNRFNVEYDHLVRDAGNLFEDVVDDFYRIDRIKARFERWKFLGHDSSYEQAYIGLCLPKLFSPLVKLRLLNWNPLEESYDFEEMGWFETLMFFGFREEDEPSKDDPDVKLMPSLVEKVLVPKLTVLVDTVWDPMSSSQTRRLAALLSRLVQDYPSINADSKQTQALLKAVVGRMRRTLEDDVFMPLYPKEMLENRSSGPAVFFHRQFWSSVKLLGNMLLFHDMVSDKVLKELTLDGILNRYLLLALYNSPVNQESIIKCQAVVSTFPKEWFLELEEESTLPGLQTLCRYLMHAAATLDRQAAGARDVDKKEARDGIKQLTKLLVNIRAMDHALSMANQYSVKI